MPRETCQTPPRIGLTASVRYARPAAAHVCNPAILLPAQPRVQCRTRRPMPLKAQPHAAACVLLSRRRAGEVETVFPPACYNRWRRRLPKIERAVTSAPARAYSVCLCVSSVVIQCVAARARRVGHRVLAQEGSVVTAAARRFSAVVAFTSRTRLGGCRRYVLLQDEVRGGFIWQNAVGRQRSSAMRQAIVCGAGAVMRVLRMRRR